MKVTFWKGVARKIRPDAKTPRGKELSQMSLGKRISRTFDRIELKGLKAGFEGKINFLGGGIKLKKIKLDADSMVSIANALQNSGHTAQMRVANYFVRRHFLNYFKEEFHDKGQIAVLERLIDPYRETSATMIKDAFGGKDNAINELQKIIAERVKITEKIEAARPFSPAHEGVKGALVGHLFNTALGGMTRKVDLMIDELQREKGK